MRWRDGRQQAKGRLLGISACPTSEDRGRGPVVETPPADTLHHRMCLCVLAPAHSVATFARAYPYKLTPLPLSCRLCLCACAGTLCVCEEVGGGGGVCAQTPPTFMLCLPTRTCRPGAQGASSGLRASGEATSDGSCSRHLAHVTDGPEQAPRG